MFLAFHNQAVEIGRKFLSSIRLGVHVAKLEAVLRGGVDCGAAAPGRRNIRGGQMNILNENNWFLGSTNFKLFSKTKGNLVNNYFYLIFV